MGGEDTGHQPWEGRTLGDRDGRHVRPPGSGPSFHMGQTRGRCCGQHPHSAGGHWVGGGASMPTGNAGDRRAWDDGGQWAEGPAAQERQVGWSKSLGSGQGADGPGSHGRG